MSVSYTGAPGRASSAGSRTDEVPVAECGTDSAPTAVRPPAPPAAVMDAEEPARAPDRPGSPVVSTPVDAETTVDAAGPAVGTLVARSVDVARSEEHTTELQSLMRISYAVLCLKKKTRQRYNQHY